MDDVLKIRRKYVINLDWRQNCQKQKVSWNDIRKSDQYEHKRYSN